MKWVALLPLALALFVSENARSETPGPVDPAQLDQLIAEADEVVVSSISEKPSTLFRSKKREDIDALRRSLQVEKPKDDNIYFCACLGSESVVLRRGGQDLAEIRNHHGVTISMSRWNSDAQVVDPDAWVQWFADRGIKGPEKELLSSRAEAEDSRKHYARWLAAMPASLRPIWEKPSNQNSLYGYDVKALAKALPQESDATNILALLGWYGSGAGPWSGYPAYERAAEELLLNYPTPVILAAVQNTALSEAQIEGLARLFGGWTFYKYRPTDDKLIPDDLRQKLWQHTRGTKDRDKYQRAKSSFAKKPSA